MILAYILYFCHYGNYTKVEIILYLVIQPKKKKKKGGCFKILTKCNAILEKQYILFTLHIMILKMLCEKKIWIINMPFEVSFIYTF